MKIHAYTPHHSPWILRATVPMPSGNGRRRGLEGLELVLPTGQAVRGIFGELVAQLADHDIVELFVPMEGGTPGQRETYELRKAGTSMPPRTPALVPTLALAATPGAFSLVVTDGLGERHEVSLSGAWTGAHRRNRHVLTGSRTVKVGEALGHLHVWATARADAPHQIEWTINWTAGAGSPDVFFRKVELAVPAGWDWARVIGEPVTLLGGDLVPDGDWTIPHLFQRPFRFVTFQPALAEAVMPWSGWGVADWTEGGWLAYGMALPDLAHTFASAEAWCDKDAADWAMRLFGLRPVYGWTANAPSPLQPTAGNPYGGATGLIGIEPFRGMTAAGIGLPVSLERFYIEQLRDAVRDRAAYDPATGLPVRLSQHTMPTVPPAYTETALTHPYFRTLTAFDEYDGQHRQRALDALAWLGWMDNDPLAWLYMESHAQEYRAAKAPGTPGLGTDLGRELAWSMAALAHAVARARADGNPRGAEYERVLRENAEHIIGSQMANGLTLAGNQSKIQKDPPFGDGKVAFYWAHRSQEVLFHEIALKAVQAVGVLNTELARYGIVWGMLFYGWRINRAGGYGRGAMYRYPCGLNQPGEPRWASRADWPAGLQEELWAYEDANPPHAYEERYSISLLAAGCQDLAPKAPGLLLAFLQRWIGVGSLPEARRVLESWGLRENNTGSGPHQDEGWGALLATLQRMTA